MAQKKAVGLVGAGRSFNAWLNRITNALIAFTGIVILLMAFVYTYGSLKRYIFRAPDSFAYLGISILMLLVALAPLAGVQMARQHIVVDFIGGSLPKIVRGMIANLIGPLMGLAFCGAIVYTSWNEAMYAWLVGQNTIAAASIPTFPFKVLVPILSGLICLVLLVQIIEYLVSFTGLARAKPAAVSE